jgi:hypothetical protein
MHIYIDLLETFRLFLIKKDRIQRVLIIWNIASCIGSLAAGFGCLCLSVSSVFVVVVEYPYGLVGFIPQLGVSQSSTLVHRLDQPIKLRKAFLGPSNLSQCVLGVDADDYLPL